MPFCWAIVSDAERYWTSYFKIAISFQIFEILSRTWCSRFFCTVDYGNALLMSYAKFEKAVDFDEPDSSKAEVVFAWAYSILPLISFIEE